jgi:hypothetical protein
MFPSEKCLTHSDFFIDLYINISTECACSWMATIPYVTAQIYCNLLHHSPSIPRFTRLLEKNFFAWKNDKLG